MEDEVYEIVLKEYIKNNKKITTFYKVIKNDEFFKQKDVVHSYSKSELSKYQKDLTVTILYEDKDNGSVYLYFHERENPFLEEIRQEIRNSK